MRPARILAIAALAVFASACTLRSGIHVDFNGEETGTITIIMAADQALRDAMAENGNGPDWENPDKLSESFENNNLDDLDFTYKPYKEGEFQGVAAVNNFRSLEELNQILRQLGDGEEGLIFETDGETLRFTAPNLNSALGADEDNELGELAEILTLEMQLAVKLPGKTETHNATRVANDGTLYWEYTLGDATGPAQPEAVARLGGDSNSAMIVAAGLTIAAGVAVGVWASRRRSQAETVQMGNAADGALTCDGDEEDTEPNQWDDQPQS